nr:hypothetical protein [Paenibacillus ginsengihumi]
MLHFVQQFRCEWLQTREHRPKYCTKCNIEPQIGPNPPFLLYKIQHYTTFAGPIENLGLIHGPKFQVPQATSD